MRGRQSALRIQMNDQTHTMLYQWLDCQKTLVGLARRTHALLLLEQRHLYTQVAQLVGLTDRNLRKWAKRFHELGISRAFEKPRPGRTPTYTCKAGQHASTRHCDDMLIRCDTP